MNDRKLIAGMGLDDADMETILCSITRFEDGTVTGTIGPPLSGYHPSYPLLPIFLAKSLLLEYRRVFYLIKGHH